MVKAKISSRFQPLDVLLLMRLLLPLLRACFPQWKRSTYRIATASKHVGRCTSLNTPGMLLLHTPTGITQTWSRRAPKRVVRRKKITSSENLFTNFVCCFMFKGFHRTSTLCNFWLGERVMKSWWTKEHIWQKIKIQKCRKQSGYWILRALERWDFADRF